MVEEFALAIERWTDFYVLVGSAAFTLLGLIFVAVSINLDLIAKPTKSEDLTAFSSQIYLNFLAITLISLVFMIPRQNSYGLGIPLLLIFSLLAALSPLIAQGMLLFLVVISMWLIVPLFFTPHGIFMRQENVFKSIVNSLKMARFTLPTSSMFVLAVFVISQGLNFLWAVPEDNSWMTAVGIAGHAFVTTALLAASFIYYRDMNAWLEIVFERLKPDAAARQT